MVRQSTRVNSLDAFGDQIPKTLRRNPEAALAEVGGDYGLEKKTLSEWSGMPANDDIHAIIRTDTGACIGAVGNKYKPFSNVEFFVPPAQALIDTGAEIERIQITDGGTRAFMRLSWSDEFNVKVGDRKVGDIVGRRAILSTSHDSKYAGKCILQMLRLACSNGMTIPVAPYEVTLIHTSGGEQQLIDMTELAPTIGDYVEKFEVASEIMAGTKVSEKRTEELVVKVADPGGHASTNKDGSNNKAMDRVSTMLRLINGMQPEGDGKALKNTAWGVYQGCVDWYTHRGGSTDDSELGFKRLLPGASGGSASKQIVKAWNVITSELDLTDQIKAATSN